MIRNKKQQTTQDYDEWLIGSLKNKKEAKAYLQVALEEFQQDGNVQVFLVALRNVAKAKGGIGRLAQKTGLNRESLYKSLSSRGNPKLLTLGVLLNELGFQFSIKERKSRD